MPTIDQAMANIEVAKRKSAAQRNKMMDVKAIREGRWDDVAPDLWSQDVPEPMIANFIDVAASSTAEAVAPLPSFTCANPNMSTETARKAADKRTKIINHYIQHSRLGDQNVRFADQLNTYGFAAYLADVDYEAELPCVYVLDTFDSYYGLNMKGKTVWFARCFRRNVLELLAEYEEYAAHWQNLLQQRKADVEVIAYYGADEDIIFVPEAGVTLARVSNPLGRCRVTVVERPKLGDYPRGQYDDVVWIQLARAMMAQYTLKIAEDVANAPIILPEDAQELEFGPNATWRTRDPNGAKRLDVGVPQHPFAEAAQLAEETRMGSRHPQARDGESDASIITGKGVQALMGGDTLRIKTLQGKIAIGLTDVAMNLLELDEKIFGNKTRSVFGLEAGAPFELRYTPSKDIAGNYTCSVTYGLVSGLDPNRALVFLLQLQNQGDLSMDTVMRNLPFDFDVTAEQKKIAVEQVRMALLQSVAATAQAIPAMAAQGADPTKVVGQLSTLLQALQKGSSIEDAAEKAFAPAPPPPQTSSPEETAAGEATPPGATPPGQAGPVPPGGATPAPGPADRLLMAMTGTTPSGNPALGLTTSTRRPV